MGRQLSLNIGGATVDTCQLGGVKFAKGVAEIDNDFNKGDDILITVRCRLHGGKVIDKYDAHDNIKETVKTLIPVATEIVELRLDTPGAYKAKTESEDDAKQGEAASQAAKAKANAPAKPPEREPAPAGDDRALASVS